MNTIDFNKLLLKTAVCCMASDGNIDEKEIAKVKSMYEKSELFSGLDFQEELNQLINKINLKGKGFFNYYFDLLKRASLTQQEELMIIILI